LKLLFCPYLIFLCDRRSNFGNCQTDIKTVKKDEIFKMEPVFNSGKAFVFTIMD
jgi:hypothetical protein